MGVGSTYTARMARMTNHDVPRPLSYSLSLPCIILEHALLSFIPSFMRIYLVLYSLPSRVIIRLPFYPLSGFHDV